MTEREPFHTCAVLVTYFPDLAHLAVLLPSLRAQVRSIVVVDNSGASEWHARIGQLLAPGETLLPMPGNVGLAAAQNAGLVHAREVGATHVLWLDQDSLVGADMVACLQQAWLELDTDGRTAAVGPTFHDLHAGRDEPFVRIGALWNRKIHASEQHPHVRCDFLISSGCFVPMAVIDVVGAMDEALFIDNVDLEWCFRATARGYRFYGVREARMRHRIGDSRGALGRVIIHGPERLYYMMRNRVRLYGMPATPWRWTTQDVPRLIFKLLFFSLVVAPRARNLACMVRGLRDGMWRRGGPMPGRKSP